MIEKIMDGIKNMRGKGRYSLHIYEQAGSA